MPQRRRGFTGRALVLGGVVVLLVVVLAAPLHRYLTARSSLADAQRQDRNSRAALADLQRQQLQWNDPAYVRQQARSRLQYAMPGDTVYVVVTPQSRSSLSTAGPRDTDPTELPGQTWNERLWGSVQSADRGS
jgi:cell division protein FtsB